MNTMATIEGVPHFVYTAFGARDEVLYVGCAANPRARIGQHESSKDWWQHEVARVAVESFTSREEALSEETARIVALQPKYNITHHESNRPAPPVDRRAPRVRREGVKTYQAVASRDGKFWLVHVPEIGQHTQARNLAEVDEMARDLISLVLDVPPDSFDIDRDVDLSESVRHYLELADKYASEAAWFQSESAAQRRFAARAMRDEGMTVRDIGAALGISHQRAQQLISS